MGLVPNFEFVRIKNKVTQVFVMLKSLYMKSSVRLLKVGFMA